jgi:hypothetical protein
MWPEVSSSVPHLLHEGLLVNPKDVMFSKKGNNNHELCPVVSLGPQKEFLPGFGIKSTLT